MPKEVRHYTHRPEPKAQPVDPAPGQYYVSVLDKDTGRVGLLYGPVRQHQSALDKVRAAQALAEEADPRAVWYAYGTVRMEEGYSKPGVFNGELGL